MPPQDAIARTSGRRARICAKITIFLVILATIEIIREFIIMSNMIHICSLLSHVAKEYLSENYEYSGLTKTKLIKMAYLTEYYYYKRFRTRLTDAEWVYYLYGPYLYDYSKHLENCPFSIQAIEGSENEFNIIELDPDYSRIEEITDFDIKRLIKNIIREFGRRDLEEILDFIYFETEPMQNVQKRKDLLNFSTISSEEVKIKNNLNERDMKAILVKYKARTI
jgi:hypothetical protein